MARVASLARRPVAPAAPVAAVAAAEPAGAAPAAPAAAEPAQSAPAAPEPAAAVAPESPSPAHRVRQRRAVLDKRGRHEPVRVFASRWERHRLLRVGWELARGDGVAGELDVLGSDLLPQPGEDELLRVLSNDARGVKRLLDA